MPSISLDNLPHRCDLWHMGESISTDGTKRLQTRVPTKVGTNVHMWAEPISAEAKVAMGYEVKVPVFRFWFKIASKDLVESQDIIRWGNHAYKIQEWLICDSGPTHVQHIEAMVEGLPALPPGIS
jgi:hypothetical protein